MSTNDEAGALAAAQYFMGDLYWYMYATGDTAEWDAIADDACVFCDNVLDDVAEMVAADSRDVGDVPAFDLGYSTTITDSARYTATVHATQPPSRRVNGDDTVIEESPGGRYELHFAIAWNGDWTILAVDATPLDETPA